MKWRILGLLGFDWEEKNKELMGKLMKQLKEKEEREVRSVGEFLPWRYKHISIWC